MSILEQKWNSDDDFDRSCNKCTVKMYEVTFSTGGLHANLGQIESFTSGHVFEYWKMLEKSNVLSNTHCVAKDRAGVYWEDKWGRKTETTIKFC